jgi:hypothetical protein
MTPKTKATIHEPPCHDRQRAARIEHDQWLKDHPDFSSQEMLDAWRDIRVQWGLATPDTPRKSA